MVRENLVRKNKLKSLIRRQYPFVHETMNNQIKKRKSRVNIDQKTRVNFVELF